jgi:LysR family transcriptional regulator, regulator for metE and metH
MELEVRHLRLVDAIVAAGSVTKAADRLHLTQSALSHQLRDLEDRLQTPLFARVGKRMVLTPAGGRIHAIARRVLSELQACEEDVRQIGRHGRGVIRVCTQCNTGYYWLPPSLERFHHGHPGIEVQIRPEATMRPLEALLEGELDVAVVTDEVHDERFVTRPLFRDEQVVLVSPSHPLAKRRAIEPSALSGEHLMLYSAAPGHSFTLTRVLAPAGVQPARLSRVPLTEAIIEMVRAGMGVSVLPRWSIEPAIRDGLIKALRITEAGVFRQWTAVQLAARQEPPYIASFLDLLSTRAIPARAAQPGRSRRSGHRRSSQAGLAVAPARARAEP